MRSQLPVQAAAHCREQELLGALASHGVIEYHILLGELQQHRIIEELADAHVFTQALQRVGANQRMSPVWCLNEVGAIGDLWLSRKLVCVCVWGDGL